MNTEELRIRNNTTIKAMVYTHDVGRRNMLNLIIHNQSEDQKKAVDVIASENIRILEEAKAGETCYVDSQGWLDTEEWAGEENIKRLEEIAKEIRENADAFVLIGVGGSNNAARSVIEALKKDDAPEIIYAGNTLSPYALNQMLKRLKGKSVYIDCIAKNFETLEPGSSFRILREYMESEYGKEESAKRSIIGIKRLKVQVVFNRKL